jgi:putative acetyltransferase
VHIEPRPSDDVGLVVLLDLALTELFTRYPDSSSTHSVDPATSFLVALQHDSAVGYLPTPPYGKYIDDPLTRCYTKPLA